MSAEGSAATGVRESRDRLYRWLGSVSLGRFELPVYRNPGELKRDVRVVIEALDRLSQDTLEQLEADRANGVTYGSE